jgi:hypothetical protein
MVVGATLGACTSSSKASTVTPSTTRQSDATRSSSVHTPTTRSTTTSTSIFGGLTRDQQVHTALENALQAARFAYGTPTDYRQLTAADFERQLAQTTFAPIPFAGKDVVGFAAESATRIVFVIQVTSYEWACLAIDDVGGTATPTFGHATARDDVATVDKCSAHP